MMSIDKYFKITIISLIIIEVISLLSFKNSPYDIIAFLVIILLTLFLSLKKLEYGLFILLAELFVGGKGYLFAIDFNGTQLSIRMGLFLVIIGVWLYQKYKNKQYKPRYFNHLLNKNKIFSLSYVILIVFIGIGVIKGLLQNDFNNTFFDFNAWIFFLLFIIFIDQIKSLRQIKQITSIFFAAIFWLSLKTIIVLYLFSHSFVFIGDPFYKWLRDTGVGEITYISGNIYRIFFQSHIFILLGFFILFTIFIYLIKDKKVFDSHRKSQSLFLVTLFTILISTTILISQSRSFWLAGLITFILLIITLLFTLKIKKNIMIGLILFALILGAFDSAVIYIITQSSSIELITARASKPTTEAASNSRINQLQPLFTEIKKDPLIGSGFGATATYVLGFFPLIRTVCILLMLLNGVIWIYGSK